MSYRTLPEELQIKAQEELNEVPSRISSDIAQLKEWMEKQPHLNATIDDQLILTFLRHAKFSLERAKEKIDAFCTARSAMPEFFHDRDPFAPEIQEVLKRGVITVIRDSSNATLPTIFLIRWEGIRPELLSVRSIYKVIIMIVDIVLLEDDNSVINGVQILQDLSGFSISYLSQITLTLLKQSVILVQNVFPIRMKAIHVINSPSYGELIYNIMKPLMKHELGKRFHVYAANGSHNIKQDIPLSLLPNEYGGTAGTIDEIAAAWKKKVESYRDWFMEDGQYGTDETKRIGRHNSGDLSFGEEGSFRKLEVD